MRDHVAEHDLVDVLASLTTARDATTAVNASTYRRWDIVRLRRRQAAQHGEAPDPVTQVLSTALVSHAALDRLWGRWGRWGNSRR
ncbi:hypothetical protein [Streptomyces virginiae]